MKRHRPNQGPPNALFVTLWEAYMGWPHKKKLWRLVQRCGKGEQVDTNKMAWYDRHRLKRIRKLLGREF